MQDTEEMVVSDQNPERPFLFGGDRSKRTLVVQANVDDAAGVSVFFPITLID